MASSSISVRDREQLLGEVEKLVHSRILHNSDALCRLLRYLADQAVEHPGVPVKEYRLATEVFGRPANFDSQLDSTIRVQAGRLRVKLAEYYSTEGIDDQFIVDLPKGTYALSFHRREAHHPAAHGLTSGLMEVEHVPASTVAPARERFLKPVLITLCVLLTVAATGLSAVLLATRRSAADATAVAPRNDAAVPAAYKIFWKSFLSGAEEPRVIFSNALFVGRPESGMRYYNSASDARETTLDHYTGFGEVLAVHELDQVFGLLHQSIRVKRGSLFSLDDAKNNNLIFVGSPAENLALLELPGLERFVFRRLLDGPRKGDLAIINTHPETGEAAEFLPSPSKDPLVEDYAVIGFKRGLTPSQSVVILAGATTVGTEAAVEYVCRKDSLEDLLRRLSVGKTSDVQPFEAVLHVKVTHGVPVGSELVAIRTSPK
jgi:hypothetical protein